MSRTAVKGGWVVGYRDGNHALLPGGTVVFENDRIVFVGFDYEEHVDHVIDAQNMLVSPGLIDTHVHVGTRGTHRLISDGGRKDIYGQPFLHWTLARPGVRSPGDLRFDHSGEERANPDVLAARFTASELLRNGVTTFVEVGSRQSLLEKLATEVEALGLRAYLGPGFQSAFLEGTSDGRWRRNELPDSGAADLKASVEFIEKNSGRANDRIRGILVPREAEFTTPSLLRDTATLADDLNIPIQIHASYSPLEWAYVVETFGCTPVEYLSGEDFLSPRVTLGHGNLVAESGLTNWAGGNDLRLIAESGATVAHSPTNIFRRGRSFDWALYKQSGVQLSLGTDTYPRDMFMQMRAASIVGKVVALDFTAATAAEVFTAATLGGARSLGREDLGRLAPGAKADIVLIDLQPNDSLRMAPLRDPIKEIVECGFGEDVKYVIIDGIPVMREGRIPGVDIPQLRRDAQESAELFWDSLSNWEPSGKSADDWSPWSFPLLEQ